MDDDNAIISKFRLTDARLVTFGLIGVVAVFAISIPKFYACMQVCSKRIAINRNLEYNHLISCKNFLV
jgi:hypothetical protein